MRSPHPLTATLIQRCRFLARLWLGPRRDPKPQSVFQRPPGVGPARRHRRCPRPPHLGCARPVEDVGAWQRLAPTRVGHDNMVVRRGQGHPPPPPPLPPPPRRDPAAARPHPPAGGAGGPPPPPRRSGSHTPRPQPPP